MHDFNFILVHHCVPRMEENPVARIRYKKNKNKIKKKSIM
jgi:hypothetical protein